MSGPTPKHGGKRQKKKANVIPFRQVARKIEVPSPPRGLLRKIERIWETYWNSQLAQVVDPDTDLPAITRLFTLYDERERSYQTYRKGRLIKGSRGQPVLNPLARVMLAFDAEIRRMEDRLGLSPRSRLQLGIQTGPTLDDLNRDLYGDEEKESQKEEDPRKKKKTSHR